MGSDAEKPLENCSLNANHVPTFVAAARAEELLVKHGNSATQFVIDAIQAAVRRGAAMIVKRSNMMQYCGPWSE